MTVPKKFVKLFLIVTVILCLLKTTHVYYDVLVDVFPVTYSKTPANLDITKKIAYISRHPGTVQDFRYIEENLQLEQVDYFLHYGIEFFSQVVNETQARYICENYESVIISDCLTDGWEFIKHEDLNCKNVIFVVSNRFDICVIPDQLDAFYSDFTNALNREDEYRAIIVANNEFEIPYIKNKNIELKHNYQVIRPFGNSEIEPQVIDEEDVDTPCLIIDRFQSNRDILTTNLAKVHVKCKLTDEKYGGPKTLSQYNSIVVHLPYQVSIMKMWENLGSGVLMAIPSPAFYETICSTHECSDASKLMETKDISTDERPWWTYVDFYLPEYEKCFIQFDTWKELATIIKKKGYIENINHCRDLIETERKEALKSWKQLIIDMN